jgi:hypothetical protein
MCIVHSRDERRRVSGLALLLNRQHHSMFAFNNKNISFFRVARGPQGRYGEPDAVRLLQGRPTSISQYSSCPSLITLEGAEKYMSSVIAIKTKFSIIGRQAQVEFPRCRMTGLCQSCILHVEHNRSTFSNNYWYKWTSWLSLISWEITTCGCGQCCWRFGVHTPAIFKFEVCKVGDFVHTDKYSWKKLQKGEKWRLMVWANKDMAQSDHHPTLPLPLEASSKETYCGMLTLC